MNLIKDLWLPVVRKDGTKEKVAIHQLLDSYDSNPVMEIDVPRPDFKNTLYQLLIGIVQVSAMPKDEEEWAKFFEVPYNHDDFSKLILKYEMCFEIDCDGAAFMQDLDLREAAEKPISDLLFDAPSANAIKNNQAHFVKQGTVNKVDIYWAAVALYTLQTFAPTGGAGHRVGLRGGGPLTTMLLPIGEATLWQKLWINTISQEKLSSLPGDIKLTDNADIFPWLKSTKQSASKGSRVYSSRVHPFHHFFGMPRRIRLNCINERGLCDLTGCESEALVSTFITKNCGNSYDGKWDHPLGAYRQDTKDRKAFPQSIKSKSGGVSYLDWLGLAIESKCVMPAYVVRLANSSNDRREIVQKTGVTLWTSGFYMEKMDARCWYESSMPIFALKPSDSITVSKFIGEFVKQAQNATKNVRSSIKSAWTNVPSSLGGDMSFIDTAFREGTEEYFYEILKEFVTNIESVKHRNSLIIKWGDKLKEVSENLFDENVLAQQTEGLNMKRVVKARQELSNGIAKMIKKLNKFVEVVPWTLKLKKI